MLMRLSGVNDWRDNVERLRAWFMRCYEERPSNGDEPSTWILRVWLKIDIPWFGMAPSGWLTSRWCQHNLLFRRMLRIILGSMMSSKSERLRFCMQIEMILLHGKDGTSETNGWIGFGSRIGLILIHAVLVVECEPTARGRELEELARNDVLSAPHWRSLKCTMIRIW